MVTASRQWNVSGTAVSAWHRGDRTVRHFELDQNASSIFKVGDRIAVEWLNVLAVVAVRLEFCHVCLTVTGCFEQFTCRRALDRLPLGMSLTSFHWLTWRSLTMCSAGRCPARRSCCSVWRRAGPETSAFSSLCASPHSSAGGCVTLPCRRIVER